MNILVTGYKGFIGQNMVIALRKEGHHVTTFEWGETLSLEDIDQVVHLGAISETTEQDVNKIMRQNYEFTVALLEECNAKRINIQYASSASVYGKGSEFKEHSDLHPESPYAWSKYLVDRYVESKDWNTNVQGFRYFNVYGQYEEHKKQPSPFTVFRRQAKQTGSIKLFKGSENMLRDFVPVERVIEIHQAFFELGGTGIWNVGTGVPRSFLSVAQEIAQECEDYEIEYIPMPEGLEKSYQYYTCADLTRLNATLSGILL